MSQFYMATCSFCGFRQDVQNPIFYCCQCNTYCNETGRLLPTYDQISSENKYLRGNHQIAVDKYNALLNQFNHLNAQYITQLAHLKSINKKMTIKIGKFGRNP